MISVLKSGLYTTLQDGGRFGYRSIGVPLSGAMDMHSAACANLLLGNERGACILEFTGMPPALEFSIKTHIAVTGADLTVYINNEKRSLGVSILIAKGDRLTFSPIKAGWRGYIAVKNGFLSQVSLKSQSQYKGITVSTQIKKGELLLVKAARSVVRVDSLEMPGAKSFHSSTIEVYKGPEFEMLSQEIQKQLLLDVFTISSSSNRMATILNEQISGVIPEIITAPVQPGTVQLTPSGKLLILMRDAQTSGGYARVFQGAENAINLVAQKRPNETMTFKLIE